MSDIKKPHIPNHKSTENLRVLDDDHQVEWCSGSGRGRAPAKDMTPLKAIRRKCLDCSSGSSKEVLHCPIPLCPLYPYRLGHRPKFQSVESPPMIDEDVESEGAEG